jgi:hypothetical protein
MGLSVFKEGGKLVRSLLGAHVTQKGAPMRLGVLTLCAILSALAVAPTAGADKPVKVPPTPGEDSTITGACSFDVRNEILTNRSFTIVFSNGMAVAAGAVKVRLTNLSDPSKSIDLNISGPGKFTFTEDGGFVLQGHGSWLFIFTADALGPGSPGMLLLTTGYTTFAVDGDGNASFTPAQNTTDLCAALA